MTSTDVALAPLGGWPALLLVIALVVLAVAAFHRLTALDLEVVDEAPVPPANVRRVVPPFDWTRHAPELLEA